MNCAVVVFTKTPELSGVKTRLAKTIGSERARNFYSKSLEVTQKLLSKIEEELKGVDVYWAVAEEAALKHKRWHNCQVLFQGEGKLGERLSRVYTSLKTRYHSVCFMGGDSPHLDLQGLHELIERSNHMKGFILAPTSDGGFYFFSGNESLPEEVWTSVEYSQNSTCSELADQLSSQGRVFWATESFDIDEYSDLEKFSNYNLWKDPIDEQLQLKIFAHELLLT